MHLIALSVLVQIACAVHCVRNSRSGLWLMVIIFLSIPGCLAYLLFEVLPQYSARREVRSVKQAAARALDPEREIREAQDSLDIADTAANRTALGDALAGQGRWREAIVHFQEAAAKTPAPERATQMRLARACLEAGEAERSRDLLEALPETASKAEEDRGRLLLARALEECGEAERALALYADLAARMPGGEPLCRQAALLLTLGRRDEARAALGEVEKRLKRIDRFERSRDSDMYDWAARTLAELREGQAGS